MLEVSPAEWKELRKNQGLTQHELADEVGCHWTLISKFERGTRKPNPELRDLLLRKLGQDPDKYIPIATLENIRNNDLKNRLIQLLRKNTDENRREAKEIINQFDNSNSLTSIPGQQFLLNSKATLAQYEENYEDMLKYALKGLYITRPKYSQTGQEGFDEDKIATYNLTLEEIGLVNRLAVARTNLKPCEKSGKSAIEKSVNILVNLKASLERTPYYDEERAKMHIILLYNLTKSLGLLKRYAEAIPLCDKGIELCKNLRNSHFEPLLMFNKVCILLHLGKIKDGVSLLEKTYAIFKGLGRYTEFSKAVKFIEKEFDKKNLGAKINNFILGSPNQDRLGE
jgi:transcriptional regulator with XRE-family HTH domain